MKSRKVTIILGAGASKGYARWPYPLLSSLLPRILEYACKLSESRPKQRQQHFLAYALSTSHEIPGPDLASEPVPKEIIQQEFKRIKALLQNDLSLTAVFGKLENQNCEASTKAYWALTYAIAVYMWQMAKDDIDQHSISQKDRPHEKLMVLIDRMLSNGIIVNVVDFNWDCVLERSRCSLGKNCQFGWDCGRQRKVLADEMNHTPLSTLVEANRLQTPLDEAEYSSRAGLIKPHGDWCTFIRGATDVFYRGGRHSQTHSATFAPKLADISPSDKFVRTSIMPPTNSKFRHGSQYYEDEKQRLICALSHSDTVISIGWSASGTDNFYGEIFRNAFADNSPTPNLYIIDRSPEGAGNSLLERRFRELFGGRVTLRDVQLSGFNNAAVETLEQLNFS